MIVNRWFDMRFEFPDQEGLYLITDGNKRYQMTLLFKENAWQNSNDLGVSFKIRYWKYLSPRTGVNYNAS